MTQKTVIMVLNHKGEPLMPTTRCKHVRELLKGGLAVPVSNNPFTIKLKYDTDNIKQNVYFGEDTGRENVGGSASDKDGNCLFMSQLKTSNKGVRKSMQIRAYYRKERRRHKRIKKQRKAIRNGTTIKNGKDDVLRTNKTCKSVHISYPGMEKLIPHKVIRGAESQFNNRSRKCDSLTPSGRQLIQMHILMLDNARKFLPITHVCLERVRFDFLKLENVDIKVWEYSKGPLYGFNNYKEYVNARQEGKCLICGKNHIDEYHHIIPRYQGGTDRVNNIAGLCYSCHQSINGVHKNEGTQNILLDFVGELGNGYSIGLLNSVMPALIETMKEYCDKNNLIFVVTDGHKTAKTRKALGFDCNKTLEGDIHYIDAYCISLAGRKNPKIKDVYFPDILHEQQRFKKKSKNNINKMNQREYYIGKDCVAKNRHKAMEQKEDSLEEYMYKYAKDHTPTECARRLHEINIKPAKREYTFHRDGKISPFHVGDTIKYEKKQQRSCH